MAGVATTHYLGSPQWAPAAQTAGSHLLANIIDDMPQNSTNSFSWFEDSHAQESAITSDLFTSPSTGQLVDSDLDLYNIGLDFPPLLDTTVFGDKVAQQCAEDHSYTAEDSTTMSPQSAYGGTHQVDRETKVADYVVQCLTNYGICVVDNFLGENQAMEVLKEVCVLDALGLMQEGQLVAGSGHEHHDKNIRSDKIAWVERASQPGCAHIGKLLTRLDTLMYQCRDRLGKYHINGRTQAMVACYPGHGSAYKKHVDNPNRDGRCITSIFYLNKDWDIAKHGGLLRIYPAQFASKVADVEPVFDRQVFFWSDSRNPHEVQPSFRSRLAITVWYFDRDEREAAKQRYQAELRLRQE